jgi:hypothetical protein
MDDQLKREVSLFVETLAKTQHDKLAALGTFVDLEELTAEIGDEVARQLAGRELGRRAEILGNEPSHGCPDCEQLCPVAPDPEPIILQGMRGEIEYQEPRCHCPACRRDFFPSGRPIGASASRKRHAENS